VVGGGAGGGGAGAGAGGGGGGGGDPISMIFVVQFSAVMQQINLPDIGETAGFKGLGAGLAWANLQITPPFSVGSTPKAETAAARRLRILGEDADENSMSSTDQFLMSMGMSAEELLLGNLLFVVLASGGFIFIHIMGVKYLTRWIAVRVNEAAFSLPTPLLFPCPEVLLFFLYYQGE